MIDTPCWPPKVPRMIHPTSKFVLLQWVPKGESIAILLPDGATPSSGGGMVVLALGPDVPKEPPIKEGSKVLLRGDSPKLNGVDEKKKIAMVHYEWIMAVVTDGVPEMTDEQIRALAGN